MRTTLSLMNQASALSPMHFFFIALTLCIYCRKCFAYVDDSSDFSLTDDLTLDTYDLFTSASPYDNDLWDLSSTPFVDLDDDDDPLLDELSACALLPSPLARRGGETCTNEKPPTVEKPIIEIRPLGRTKDAPLLPKQPNYNICMPDMMGYDRRFVVCDSGFELDRRLTSTLGVFDLTNCDICISWPHFFTSNHADSSVVDILQGCFAPRQTWCCEAVIHQSSDGQRVSLVESCQSCALYTETNVDSRQIWVQLLIVLS